MHGVGMSRVCCSWVRQAAVRRALSASRACTALSAARWCQEFVHSVQLVSGAFSSKQGCSRPLEAPRRRITQVAAARPSAGVSRCRPLRAPLPTPRHAALPPFSQACGRPRRQTAPSGASAGGAEAGRGQGWGQRRRSLPRLGGSHLTRAKKPGQQQAPSLTDRQYSYRLFFFCGHDVAITSPPARSLPPWLPGTPAAARGR